MTEDEARQQLVDAMRTLDARGLNRGTSGNLSVRFGSGMFVTPSGITPDRLKPGLMVFVDGDGSVAEGAAGPSSEWQMHLGLYRRRADAKAIVHCHARHSTILACAHLEIPPLHYMVAVSGGASVPVAPYATFGSEELAEGVADTLDGRLACLMANHGLIALGPNLATAMAITEEIEEQAAVYCGTLAIGGPKLLDEPEMKRIIGAFQRYGQR
ncbi:MAG TPA: class II aldolase/adducin family protein [Sphingopyxis sp.]|uniref:class II aldolase/adducin family protein n=1 Tax=Sphingopyxis sp. TaxID=1908224 RepID=UPI002CD587D9|nr:class II aldolase/adducin family protein [Sphingopyxis sp.]HWW56038.1 class II aldolase/adducin family protein [Sphingopyxis sp.]